MSYEKRDLLVSGVNGFGYAPFSRLKSSGVIDCVHRDESAFK